LADLLFRAAYAAQGWGISVIESGESSVIVTNFEVARLHNPLVQMLAWITHPLFGVTVFARGCDRD